MNFLHVPDYLSKYQHLTGFDAIIQFIWFTITLYSTMIIFLFLNALLTATLMWSMLLICRVLGIPWIDGTTKGFLNRR